MKTIEDIISEKSLNCPDAIEIDGEEIKYYEKNGNAFIVSPKCTVIGWSTPGENHGDVFDNFTDKENDELGIEDVCCRFIAEPEFRLKGRVFTFKNETKELGGPCIVITFWETFEDDTDFDKLIKYVIKSYFSDKNCKENADTIKDTDYNIFVVNNRGDINPFTSDFKNVKASEETKQQKEILKAIHLASQAEKDEFYKGYKAEVAAKKEKELQKLGIKDGTYAKRNNMFTKKVVFDPETGKYKTVYAAKIGDSLKEFVTNFINE